MADFKFPVEDVEVSSAELSAAISSSTCNPPPKSKMILTGNPLATTFEVDPKHELYSREVESDLQYQDIPLPPPSINLSSKPGSPSSPISSLADLTPTRKKSISGISLPFGRSEYPTSISQASDFLVRERKQSDTTEKYPEPFLPHQSGQSFTGGTLPSFLSNPSLITTTSTAVSAPSLSSIDEDLITRAIAWLDQDAPELTLSVTPLVPLHQASLPSASNPSATTIHPPVCSNDGFSTTLSIRYCPQSSDPTQLASPPPEYHPAQAARYPFLPNPSRLKACDQDPGPWHDSLCSTVPEACKQPKLEHTHVCSNSPKCRGKMSPKNESSYPVIISAIWAITIPLGCLVCNGPWLVVYPEKPPIGIGVLILYCYLVVIMLSSMWKAAWSDPGIIPRNLDIEPEVDWDDEHNPPQEGNVTKEAQSLSQAQIRPRLVNIGDYIVPTKWCRRCRTYRPPRASHCRICDFCVQQSDHHCTFLNNCIGRKNYFVFLAFLFTTAVTMLNTMAISICHLALMTDRTANPAAIGNYVVIVLAFLLGVPVLGLLIFHIRLISRNVTTTERLRPIIIQEDGVESPAQRDVHIYSLDKWYSNWLWIVCRPNFDLEGTPPNPLLIR